MAVRPGSWSKTHLHPPVQEEHWWEGGSSTGICRLPSSNFGLLIMNVLSSPIPTSPSLLHFQTSRSLTRSPKSTSPTFSVDATGPFRTMKCLTSTPPTSPKLPPQPPSLPRRKSNTNRPAPLRLRSIDEESGMSEYDVGVLNLGTESPRSNSTTSLVQNTAFVKQWAEAGIEVPKVPARQSLWRSASFGKGPRGLKKELDDRDCGICFEYAVVPCRTLCCGKIFCTEHLADWLHGPNAEGRCPNCENACSLEGGTLSLATPTLRTPTQSTTVSRRNTLTPSNRSTFLPSPLTSVQCHSNDTLNGTRDTTSGSSASSPSSCSTSSSATASAVSSVNIPSLVDTDQEDLKQHSHHHHRHRDHHPTLLYKEGFTPLDVRSVPSMNFGGTTPFSTSWGALSRLLSIITFLMFIYKLLS
ncbi:hypothetical protein CPB83DRAFT_896615 [Crepidotus variabilis]|uniref:RING-type domain-containing protein n=1 Tax=Crepidotus variabilis TaxID=179855 RepID=A0A9P6EB69_9AGAR|nr:hypothetical protein CPB83DRAFT_896615 [Crepidotus variabilis]